MPLEIWLAANTHSQLNSHCPNPSDRKLHLLTAAFLRRVWDELPSDHTRIAVEGTEKFADGLITMQQLVRLRSMDVLETCESLWLDPHEADSDAVLIGLGRGCTYCDWYDDDRAEEYECRAAQNGYELESVRSGIKYPRSITMQAAYWARECVAWSATQDERDTVVCNEATAQFQLYREIVGYGWPVDPRWKLWRTDTVRLVALDIHRSQSFDQLPILADALQDAGCDDEAVLSHFREVKEHARGCWALDLAMGVS
jgi:hypothetical protein